MQKLNKQIMVTNSIEARRKIEELKIQTKKIKFNPDIYLIVRNIELLISELSKKEVVVRQTKKPYIIDGELKQLNDAFKYAEQLILIATLVD